MKKIFLLLSGIAFIWFGCKKDNGNSGNITTQPKTLVADAGPDTIIYNTDGGTGIIFRTVLNGKASFYSPAHIVFCSWTEIGPIGGNLLTSIKSPNTMTTEVTMVGGIHRFRLEVRDDHNGVDYDTVSINAEQRFGYQYEGIPWDSTIGVLTRINISYKPGLIDGFPGLSPNETRDSNFVNLCAFDGSCNEIGNWKRLPFVVYDSIYLTDKSLFYSSNDSDFLGGMDYMVIYANKNAGIDFTKKVSIGIFRLK
jgi:hypothetical protein